MSSELTPEEMARVTRQLKNTMMNAALFHLDEIDARTVTVLQQEGLLKKATTPALPEAEATILADRSHASRLPAPDGPLVFVAQAGDPTSRMVYPMADLILRPEPSIRRAAIEHFKHMIGSDKELLTPRSQQAIHENEEAATSEDSEKWRPAAIRLSDVVKDDWLCNAAGVRQSLFMHYEQGIENYLDEILRPSIPSLDTIDLGFWSPSTEAEKIETRVIQIVDASRTPIEAFNAYYTQFGTIPLDARISMSRVVGEWMKHRGAGADLWDALWKWADGIESPLARYHLCQALLCNPSLIKKGSETRLWDALSEIVNTAGPANAELRWAQAWQIRCELAQHYACYLALHLPGANGERIARSAWWFAEKVAGLFVQSSDVLQNVRRGSVIPHLQVTGMLTNCAHPQIEPSRLYCATVSMNSVWSLCILSDLVKGLEALSAANANETQRGQIRQYLTAFLLSSLPLRPRENGECVYAFDRTVLDTASAWCAAEIDTKESEALKSLLEFCRTMQEPDVFNGVAKLAGTGDAIHEAAFSAYLKAMAYTGATPLDTVWQCLEDKEWGKSLLTKGNAFIVVNTVDALVEIERQKNDKWTWTLPHFIADGCEAAPDGSERQSLLFGLVVITSMSTDTVSAIQRLLTGEHRGALAKDVDHWRKRIEDVRNVAPSWIAARFRAITASLHLS